MLRLGPALRQGEEAPPPEGGEGGGEGGEEGRAEEGEEGGQGNVEAHKALPGGGARQQPSTFHGNLSQDYLLLSRPMMIHN